MAIEWDELTMPVKSMVLDELREKSRCLTAAHEGNVWDETYLEAINAAIAKLEEL